MEELKANTVRLLAENKALRTEVADLDKDFRDYALAAKWKTVVFAVLLAAVGAIAIVAISTALTQRHTRDEVLCPLYKVFANSYNPNGLSAKNQGIDEYNKNFAEIRKQYAALGCADTDALPSLPAADKGGARTVPATLYVGEW